MKPNLALAILFTLTWSARYLAGADEPAGAAVYRAHCARCHDQAAAGSRIPPQSALRALNSGTILTALTTGVMKQQAADLSVKEREDVASWLGAAAAPAKAAAPKTNACGSSPSARAKGGDWTSWGNRPENWRFQPDSGIPAGSIPRLKLKWAYGIAGVPLMRSQPVVYQGRIYIGGENGSLAALDAATGCAYWSVTSISVRSGLAIGRAGGQDALFFGDPLGAVHAVALANGKELWRVTVSDHIGGLVTGTPAYAGGRLYVPLSSAEEVMALGPEYACCSFRGSVSALDAATGKLLWRTHTIEAAPAPVAKTANGKELWGPSGAGVWSSPTVDSKAHALYVTTGDNYSDPPTKTSDAVLALSLDDGRILWSKQFTQDDVFNLACITRHDPSCKQGTGPDFDFGASPILLTLADGKRCLILGQKSGMVYAVDPDRRGELLWQAKAGRGGSLGGIQWGPATDGRTIFAAVSDVAFVKSPDPAKLAIDPETGGGLTAYAADSGREEWKAPAIPCGERRPCSPAQSAAVTAVPGAVFSGSLDGHIRAYSATDGKVLWAFDTERSFDTVNGVTASGGSLDAAGAVVAEGMVFVLSGYSTYGGKAGNVMLAFGYR